MIWVRRLWDFVDFAFLYIVFFGGGVGGGGVEVVGGGGVEVVVGGGGGGGGGTSFAPAIYICLRHVCYRTELHVLTGIGGNVGMDVLLRPWYSMDYYAQI